MTPLAPLRVSEAADSLVKASTPEPFSTSKTSNWVARKGGLPPYVQHIAHDIEGTGKPPKTESEAIRLAIGIVENPPKAWDATAKAAAAKAAAEWRAKRGATGAKSTATRLGESIPLALRVCLRTAARGRLEAVTESVGADGLRELLEAKGGGFKPELKRVASAQSEKERLEVHDGGQHVGTLASRPSYRQNESDRWSARGVNGRMIGGNETCGSKTEAMGLLKKHLEDAPGRVSPSPTDGRYLVGEPQGYSGPTTFKEFPSESAARYEAGLPEKKTRPEAEAEVAALGEMVAFDILTLQGLEEELPSGATGILSEAEGESPAFAKGDRVNYQHSHFGRVPAKVTKVTSRHVHLSSSDPRVRDTTMTHKQAASKLSKTTSKMSEAVVPETMLGSMLREEALNSKQRKDLSKGEFVYPDKAPGPGAYPIDTRARAIAALSRAADPANSGDLATVQAKVYAKYPDLKSGKDGK